MLICPSFPQHFAPVHAALEWYSKAGSVVAARTARWVGGGLELASDRQSAWPTEAPFYARPEGLASKLGRRRPVRIPRDRVAPHDRHADDGPRLQTRAASAATRRSYLVDEGQAFDKAFETRQAHATNATAHQ